MSQAGGRRAAPEAAGNPASRIAAVSAARAATKAASAGSGRTTRAAAATRETSSATVSGSGQGPAPLSRVKATAKAATATSPATVAAAEAAPKAGPCSTVRKYVSGPEASGRPPSSPLAVGPQRRPTRVAPPITSGVPTTLYTRSEALPSNRAHVIGRVPLAVNLRCRHRPGDGLQLLAAAAVERPCLLILPRVAAPPRPRHGVDVAGAGHQPGQRKLRRAVPQPGAQ